MSDVGKSRVAGKPRKAVNHRIFRVYCSMSGATLELDEFLSEGWELFGSPAGNGHDIYQTMVKYEVVEPIKLPVRD